MKGEHTLGIEPRSVITENDANVFAQSCCVMLMEEYGAFPAVVWLESHSAPCGERFLCQHWRGCKIRTILPIRRHISDMRLRGFQKERLEKVLGLPNPSYTQKPGVFETIPPSVVTPAFGEGEQIASPAFQLKSKRRFTKQKAKRFLRVSAGSPKRNICLGEAIPLIKGG